MNQTLLHAVYLDLTEYLKSRQDPDCTVKLDYVSSTSPEGADNKIKLLPFRRSAVNQLCQGVERITVSLYYSGQVTRRASKAVLADYRLVFFEKGREVDLVSEGLRNGHDTIHFSYADPELLEKMLAHIRAHIQDRRSEIEARFECVKMNEMRFKQG